MATVVGRHVYAACSGARAACRASSCLHLDAQRAQGRPSAGANCVGAAASKGTSRGARRARQRQGIEQRSSGLTLPAILLSR